MNLTQGFRIGFQLVVAHESCDQRCTSFLAIFQDHALMPSRLIRRHDQFFRRLLDQPGAAGALLRERLPAEVAGRLAPGAPELVPGSFVDGELRENRTDRLYRVRTLGGDITFIQASGFNYSAT
jgi:hypothetical protein